MTNSFLLFLIALLFFTGCASGPPIKGHQDAVPPEVIIGPELQLMEIPVKKGFRAIMDDKGFAHVLAATAKSGELYHLVVDENGMIQKDSIKRPKSIGRLDLALDAQRNLHALVGKEHLLFKSDVWESLPQDSCQLFARGGKNLTCAYNVEGEEVDSPRRWDWYGFAGGSGMGACACIFPWHTHPVKMAILTETDIGWSRGILIDAATKADINALSISTDDEGTIHIVYYARAGGNLNPFQETKYLRIPSSVTQDRKNHLTGWVKMEGQKIDGRLIWANIVVDPESGFLLIPISTRQDTYQTRLMMNYHLGPEIDFFIGKLWHGLHPYLYPAGDGQFHALVVGSIGGFWTPTCTPYYLLFKQGVWSAPLELGQNNCYGSEELVSDRFGRALVLWQNEKNQLAGRWIKTRK